MNEHRTFHWPSLLTPTGQGIVFGGDYNPDQWPDATVDEDIRLMNKAQVNTVALAIFSWDRLEPSDGAFTFDWLDSIIDRLGKAGIAVNLSSATAAAPLWLYEAHPEILPVDRYGHTVNPGSRQSWRPTSPVFKEHALRLCRELAEHYRDNPYVTSWHVGNEYGWNNRYDYSDDALNAFRTWCERKYGTVEALNNAWGTAFWSQHVNGFDEVLLPRHMGDDNMVNPAQQLDFERFGNDMLLDFYKAERDAIKTICPDKPCTTNFMVSTSQCVMDYAKWAPEVDFVSNDHYFRADESHLDELFCSDALMDSLALGKPWYVMEHSTSAVQWKPLNTRKRAGELMRDSLAHVAMGADAINFFQWRQSTSGAEAFHSAMVPHAGADSKVFRGVCELGDALKALSDEGMQGTELVRSDTAILFSAESEWATRFQTLPSNRLNHWRDVFDWYQGLLDAGIRPDIIPLAYDWTEYKTIILPTMLILSDDQVNRLADFTHKGGTVIIGYATGLVDDTLRVGLGGYPGAGDGLLREMLGVRSEEFNLIDTSREASRHGIMLSNGSMSMMWQNDVTSIADNTSVIAEYTGPAASDWMLDGVPAITSHPYGDGSAIYVGCDLDRKGITSLVREIMPGKPETDVNILHTVRQSTDGSIRFDFYLNRTEELQTIHRIEGTPIRMDQSTQVDDHSYQLNRNGLLITKTVQTVEPTHSPIAGQKRVTLKDVAEAAGVSMKTASNVINGTGRMTRKTRARVEEVIRNTGYKVNAAARNLIRDHTGFITLAVPSLTPPYLAELANRIINAARRRDYSVYVTTFEEGSAKSVRELLTTFNNTISDGMILSMSEVENITSNDLSVNFPLVAVGSRSTLGLADHVTPDDTAAAATAAGYLYDRGVRNLAVIGARKPYDETVLSHATEGNAELRLRGIIEETRRRGLILNPSLIGVTGQNWTIDSAALATQRIIETGQQFDGLIALNDEFAIGALTMLRMKNIPVPDQVQVIGFDNITDGKYLQTPLTTMDSCMQWIADTSLDRLIKRINGYDKPPELLTIRSQVVKRATTR